MKLSTLTAVNAVVAGVTLLPLGFIERVSMTMIKENGRWQYLGGGGSPFVK